MRTLAPVFLTTSILAFAAGNAAAMGDFHKTKKAPDTSVSSPSSTTSDTSTGAAAPGSKSAAPVSPGPSTMSPDMQNSATKSTAAGYSNGSATTSGSTTMSGRSVDATTALANDDKQALSRQATSERSTIATQDTKNTVQSTPDSLANNQASVKPKKAKKKIAKNDNVSGNPPTSPTNGAAANSTTGRSQGGD